MIAGAAAKSFIVELPEVVGVGEACGISYLGHGSACASLEQAVGVGEALIAQPGRGCLAGELAQLPIQGALRKVDPSRQSGRAKGVVGERDARDRSQAGQYGRTVGHRKDKG